MLSVHTLNILTSSAPKAPKHPLLRYIRFFACWECGPIGTIVAAAAFATGTIFTYQALRIAIWTATKDYIEHCQAVVDSSRATAKCIQAASQELGPPPFYREVTTSNNTVYRRTMGGFILGATESRTHNEKYLWGYAILMHAGSWLLLSKICQFSWKMATQLRHQGIGLSNLRPIFKGADVENISLTPEPQHVALQRPRRNENIYEASPAISTGATVNTGDNSENLGLRHRRKKSVDIAPRLLMENPACLMGKNIISVSAALEARDWRVGERYPWPSAASPSYPSLSESVFRKLKWIPRESEKEIWLDKITRTPDLESVQSLRNLYGLEISACTGNARRVSVLHLMMSSSFRKYFNSFHWKKSFFRERMRDIFSRNDEEGFVTCYNETTEWREDIHDFVRGALQILVYPGFDFNTRNIHALWTGERDYAYVMLSADWCPWAEILNDIDGIVAMAVVTDTCLSVKDIPLGRTCHHGEIFPDQKPVLETRITARGSRVEKWSFPHKDQNPNQNWMPDWKLHLPTSHGSGVLENLNIVNGDRGSRYCTADWDNSSTFDQTFLKRPEGYEFREDLVRDHESIRNRELGGCLTYIVPPSEEVQGRKRE
ncbi:hypothetical protein BKA65DRAFT_273471 [Rhexocercosporidium sp. MPI-PUGE-AT-0058]|nr:hypothetical protein BKA65DRAFT_273471 [Rhexocercosporidium sp. MPI-PUGE-AT-0058]